MRQARSFVWVHPDDCDAPHSLDMDNEYNFNKVKWLREQFEKDGFDLNQSALVGYPLNGRIQLLSGTHRHKAAKQSGILLPVTLWLRSDVERTWGTEMWKDTIKDISVKKLSEFMVEDGFKIPPYEPVSMQEINQDLKND